MRFNYRNGIWVGPKRPRELHTETERGRGRGATCNKTLNMMNDEWIGKRVQDVYKIYTYIYISYMYVYALCVRVLQVAACAFSQAPFNLPRVLQIAAIYWASWKKKIIKITWPAFATISRQTFVGISKLNCVSSCCQCQTNFISYSHTPCKYFDKLLWGEVCSFWSRTMWRSGTVYKLYIIYTGSALKGELHLPATYI